MSARDETTETMPAGAPVTPPTGAVEPDVPPARAADFFSSPTVRALFVAAAFALVIYFLRDFQRVIGQAVLAYVITLALTPLLNWLRRHLPTWLAMTVVMLLIIALLGGFLLLLAGTAINATNNISHYQQQYTDKINEIVNWFSDHGIDLTGAAGVFSSKNVFSLLSTLVGWVSSALTFSFLLLFILLYMLIDSMSLSRRMRLHLSAPAYTRLMLFQSDVRRYWVIQTLVGLIAAVLNTALLLVMGVPFALFLGVLSFVTNYIPNIGYFIALLPAMLLAFAVKGVEGMLIVFVFYWIFNTIGGSFIAPRLNAERLDLGFTTSMVGVLFWAAVLGPVGGLVAVPMILFTREIVLAGRPETMWMAELLSHGESEEKAVATMRVAEEAEEAERAGAEAADRETAG